jgi:hypothetical protein
MAPLRSSCEKSPADPFTLPTNQNPLKSPKVSGTIPPPIPLRKLTEIKFDRINLPLKHKLGNLRIPSRFVGLKRKSKNDLIGD